MSISMRPDTGMSGASAKGRGTTGRRMSPRRRILRLDQEATLIAAAALDGSLEGPFARGALEREMHMLPHIALERGRNMRKDQFIVRALIIER